MFKYNRLINLVAQRFVNNSQHAMVIKGRPVRTTLYSNSYIVVNCPSLQFVRHYAKGKDKKKDKGKTKVHVDETQLGEVMDLENMKTEMVRCIEVLKNEYVKNLSLRSAAGAFESLPVNVDGKEHTLQELAQIVRKNPKTIVVNMAAFPQVIPAVLKAIEKSGMNLNPQQDGTTLYIPVPKVTKEYREQLAKGAKQLFIKCRDNIKDVQNKHIKLLKKRPNTSEDLLHNVEAQVVTVANGYIGEAQKILDSKQTELLGND